MKKFMMALVCLMTMVVFSSCSADDEDNEVKENMIGRWQLENVGGVKCNIMPLFTFHSNNVLSVGEKNYNYSIHNGMIKIDGKLSNHLEKLYNDEIENTRLIVKEHVKGYNDVEALRDYLEGEKILEEQRREVLDESIPQKNDGFISGKVRIKDRMYIEFVCKNNRTSTFTFVRN